MTDKSTFQIRQAREEDVPLLLDFIKQLAVYEKMLDDVAATEELISEALFGSKSNVEALIGYYENKPVCFSLYFYNFSTFKGKRGLYLEDLFVIPEMRGKGFGKQMLTHLARIAKQNGCARFEWAVLDWNEPAIKFYESFGARLMKEWMINRLDEEGIEKLAQLTENQ